MNDAFERFCDGGGNVDTFSERQTARIVETNRGREVRSPRRKHLLGVFNEKNQLVIKCGDELVIVEVPKA